MVWDEIIVSICIKNGQMPPQGPGPQQSNGNAPQQQTGQGAPQTTQNQ